MELRDRRQLALMLAPYVLGLVALVALPALVTFVLALTEYDLIRSPGLSASTTCASSPRTRSSVRRS